MPGYLPLQVTSSIALGKHSNHTSIAHYFCAMTGLLFCPAGQSHDGFFEFARDSRVKHVLGTAVFVNEQGVQLKDGTLLPAHMVIYCGGCEYQGSPSFLKGLNLGRLPVTYRPQISVCSGVMLCRKSNDSMPVHF